MGYTHYHRWLQQPLDDVLASCIAEMAKVIDGQQVCKLRGWDGTGEPAIGRLEISFNGDSHYGLDHETFTFPGYTPLEPSPVAGGDKEWMGFNFCKTARKPYDAVVTACLLIAQDWFDENTLDISSDGSWHEWLPGRTLYQLVVNREPIQVVDDD